MSFSERLKNIIEEDYNTQVNFAEAIRATKASVNDYLSSKRKPNFDVLQRIADLGYNMNWILTGKGSRKKQFLNLEVLDKYDESVIESIVVHVGGIVKNKKFAQTVITTDEEISKYALIYFYITNMIEALILELTYSNCFKHFEKNMKSNSILDDYVFEVLMPAINDYLISGIVFNVESSVENKKKLEIIDEHEFVYSLTHIYVVYSEIMDLKERMKEYNLLEYGDEKEIYKQIFDLMKNETYLMVKSSKFYNIVAKTFNIELS